MAQKNFRTGPSAAQALPVRARSRSGQASNVLAFGHLPVAIGIIVQLQKPVLGIVALATTWAYKVPTPAGSLMVVIL